MTVLSPAEVSVLLDDVRRLAARLDDWYAWLHPSALERRVGGNRPAAQVCAGCGGVGCERCDGADRTDDIAAVLVATGGARAKLEQTAMLIARAVADLTGAGNMLGQIETLIDAGADRTLDDVHERRRDRPTEWPGVREALAGLERRTGVALAPLAAERRDAEKRWAKLQKRHEDAHGKEPLRCPRCRTDLSAIGKGSE